MCLKAKGLPPPKLDVRRRQRNMRIQNGKRKHSLRSHGDQAVIAYPQKRKITENCFQLCYKVIIGHLLCKDPRDLKNYTT